MTRCRNKKPLSAFFAQVSDDAHTTPVVVHPAEPYSKLERPPVRGDFLPEVSPVPGLTLFLSVEHNENIFRMSGAFSVCQR